VTSKREWQRRALAAEWEAAVQTRLAEKRAEYHRAALDAMICLAERTAERDRARATAARLEGELDALGRVVRLAQYLVAEEDETFHLPEMRALCIGLQDLADKGLLPRPHPPGDPTPWPHPDAEVTT